MRSYLAIAMTLFRFVVVALFMFACVPDAPNGRIRAPEEPVATDPDPNPMPDPDPDPNPMPDPDPDPMPDPDPDPMPDPNAVSFARDVLPILEAHCTECHDPGRALDLTQLPLLSSGPAVAADLIIAAAEGPMPPEPRHRMTSEEIDVIRAWRDQGLNP